MKKIIIALCLVAGAVAVKAQDNKPQQPVAPVQSQPALQHPPVPPVPPQAANPDPDAGKFKFKEETHDFGEVPEGPTAECDFEFKNVGKKPIVISEAHGSCGCTVPQWPRDPILPKHKGVIHVTYNTNGRVGPINKDVFITSNAQQNPMRLHITGSVKAKAADAIKPAQK